MLESTFEYSSTFSESLAANIELKYNVFFDIKLKYNVEFVKLDNHLLAGKLIFQQFISSYLMTLVANWNNIHFGL